METTEIAKAVAKTEAEEMLSELPEKSSEMQGGPMGRGDFQGNFGEAGTVAETSEWLVPMTATGIISGTIMLAAVAICLTVWFARKKS